MEYIDAIVPENDVGFNLVLSDVLKWVCEHYTRKSFAAELC